MTEVIKPITQWDVEYQLQTQDDLKVSKVTQSTPELKSG